jgi:hypothetical protein
VLLRCDTDATSLLANQLRQPWQASRTQSSSASVSSYVDHLNSYTMLYEIRVSCDWEKKLVSTELMCVDMGDIHSPNGRKMQLVHMYSTNAIRLKAPKAISSLIPPGSPARNRTRCTTHGTFFAKDLPGNMTIKKVMLSLLPTQY